MAAAKSFAGSTGAHSATVKPNHYSPPGPIGNTEGLIVPYTEPNLSGGNIAPPIKPTPKEKGWWERWGSEALHTALDIGGAIPVIGIASDGVNAIIYGAEGDYVNAGISGASAAANLIPGGGLVAKGGKLAVKGGQVLLKTEVKLGAKVVVRKAATETAEKEAAEQAAKAAAAKKAKGKSGGKDKGKKKLKCGDKGKYGDLKKKTGDGKFDRDHIPSKAALKERAKQINGGRVLSPAQQKAIDAAGDAIAIPRQAHIDISPTHGTKNIKLAPQDATDLAGAAKRDIDAMLDKINEYDEDGGCKSAYKNASKKILEMKNEDYDRFLKEIMKKVN